MDHLDQLVPQPPQPEKGRDVVEVAELLVQPGDGVVGQADVGADTGRSEQGEIFLTRLDRGSPAVVRSEHRRTTAGFIRTAGTVFTFQTF